MIVGESWSYDDDRAKEPFQGESGKELNRMLHEAGIMRSECWLTNLVNARAPSGNLLYSIALARKDQSRIVQEMGGAYLRDKIVSRQIIDGYARLLKEIALVRPNVIIALGNSAMWALCGAWGIAKWRGSMLTSTEGVKLIPTYAPWAVMGQWENRAIMVNDLRRAKAEASSSIYPPPPAWNFITRPRFQVVMDILNDLYARAETLEDANTPDLLWLDFDLETRAGHIACAGLSWSRVDALVIPFMERDNLDGYWFLEEEAQIVHSIWQLFTHPKVAIRGQNLLYDCQYTWKHWHFIPNVKQDTMIAQHSAFVALPKGLDFLASMYCEQYRQWKPEKSSWKGA